MKTPKHRILYLIFVCIWISKLKVDKIFSEKSCLNLKLVNEKSIKENLSDKTFLNVTEK